MHVSILVSIKRLNSDISLIFPAIEIPEKIFLNKSTVCLEPEFYNVIEGETPGLKCSLPINRS